MHVLFMENDMCLSMQSLTLESIQSSAATEQLFDDAHIERTQCYAAILGGIYTLSYSLVMSVVRRYSNYHEQLWDSVKKRYDNKLDTRNPYTLIIVMGRLGSRFNH